MNLLKSLNLAVRFLLELCALAALGFWGFHTGQGAITKILLGIGAPLLMAVVWGAFVAPRAARRLHEPWRVLLECIIFGVAAVGLIAAGQPTLAWILALVFVLNRILIIAWRQSA
jgi:hypothetical protein